MMTFSARLPSSPDLADFSSPKRLSITPFSTVPKVGEGESFMGWKIQSVDATSARLQQQDRTIELQLYPRN